ncbi:2-amino-4-hydroxy-6-hydroxymethyldihydropteridine diphosphokinase [Colwellia echini]|uniref:2-amino-4-hydroxy-6-hydroxymethyldihydropteridine diphosphokinase n=1 Tax=Colwellia echini TaxID=1982103 RepID=A0ABY3MY31_9GAMM|nr:2-amino-4-hydroxy-6-hydroxymethyldihydropteridine diphosphokinase [Colwellia echini]TYK66089.1 2-amino-4-hydroxy-6-hydroxymethyldihydropteridine diphosphokinase [Colwellia echini]
MAQIYISLGSNIEREHHVKQGLLSLAEAFALPFEQLTLSALYESDPVGFEGAAFYNMVIGLTCSHSVEEVATILRNIEFAHGRALNAKKFSPRSLDLDLLLYDNLIIDSPAQLPRDEITTNAFVLWPLSEIAPNLEHPILTKTYRDLWQEYNKSSQQISIVANCW